MKVSLWSVDGVHLHWVDVPDSMSQPETIVFDGVPFILKSGTQYRASEGHYHLSQRSPVIDVERVFRKEIVAEAHSTRWMSGCVGEAKFIVKVPIEVPWAQSMLLSMIETRSIRANGVWCPELPFERAAVAQDDRLHASRARRATNAFCNEYRPRNSKLLLHMVGIDNAGRIICNIEKVIPALGNKVGEERLSLRKHLLDTGLFQAARWRTK